MSSVWLYIVYIYNSIQHNGDVSPENLQILLCVCNLHLDLFPRLHPLYKNHSPQQDETKTNACIHKIST